MLGDVNCVYNVCMNDDMQRKNCALLYCELLDSVYKLAQPTEPDLL